MKVLVFDTNPEARDVFTTALAGHDLHFFEEPVSDAVLQQHPDADAVSLFITSMLKKDQIDMLPQLKCIAPRSTGYDHIDVAYAAQKGIPTSNVPRYGSHTVAEFAFALMLALSRRIVEANRRVCDDGKFSSDDLQGFDLFGKTLGVIGTGNIGKNTVAIAHGFGMKVLMYDLYPNQSLVNDNATYVTLDELLAQSDVVSLHAPATAENTHLMNAHTIAKMKRGAYLINTARGELVDTPALVAALKDGQLGGAGLDVLDDERSLRSGAPAEDDHALMQMPNVVLTPHLAFFSKEAYREILTVAANNVVACAAGAPTNVVKV
jgi:D-lactate dehydrogenase